MAKREYKYTFPGGNTISFNTKAELDRVKYIYDLFLSPGKDLKPQKTNLDPAVMISKDNPLLSARITKAGQRIAKVEAIPTKEFDKKYKLPDAGNMNKVSAVNPYESRIKPILESKKEKQPTTYKTWVGQPYTTEEIQPQNMRYITEVDNNAQNVSQSCQNCVSLVGNEIGVTDCDGNGPYWFPSAVKWNETTQTATSFTAADIGTDVKCISANNDCHGSGCNFGPWKVIIVNPLSSLGLNSNICNFLEEAACATPSCAIPGQPIISNVVDNSFVIGISYTNPISITGPPKKIVPKIPVDYTQSNQPIPYDWACANPMTTYEPGYIPTDPAILSITYPYNVIAASATAQSSLDMIQYHTINFPSVSCQTKRYCNIAASQNPEPLGCVETRSGAYTPHFFIWSIAYFNPGKIGVDPATGMGGALSSQANTFYDTWTEMVDDLITAGEYVGNNTDTLFDLWNAGIAISWTTHLCLTCPAPLACATPNQRA